MIKTKQGDFYTPKEVLRIILKSEGYDTSADYTLAQSCFGGFFVRKKEDERD